MPSEQVVTLLSCLGIFQAATSYIYWQQAQTLNSTGQPMLLCLLALVALHTLQLVFIVWNAIHFQKHDHQATVHKLVGRVKPGWVIGLLVLSIVFFSLGFFSIFYSRFVQHDESLSKWLYILLLCMSGWATIYCCEFIKRQHNNKPAVRYWMYLLGILLAIAYLAQLGLFIERNVYVTEAYLSLVVLMASLKIWWRQTPILLNCFLLVAEIVCIISGITLLNSPLDSKLFYAVEVIKICVLLAHSLWLTHFLGSTIYRFISRHSRQKQTRPMKLSAILSLQKLIIRNDDTLQNLEMDKTKSKESECTICACQLASGQEIYNIPCRHHFHCECLKNWLLVKNTCPTCRSYVQ